MAHVLCFSLFSWKLKCRLEDIRFPSKSTYLCGRFYICQADKNTDLSTRGDTDTCILGWSSFAWHKVRFFRKDWPRKGPASVDSWGLRSLGCKRKSGRAGWACRRRRSHTGWSRTRSEGTRDLKDKIITFQLQMLLWNLTKIHINLDLVWRYCVGILCDWTPKHNKWIIDINKMNNFLTN